VPAAIVRGATDGTTVDDGLRVERPVGHGRDHVGNAGEALGELVGGLG
jgi:hypothetical protein